MRGRYQEIRALGAEVVVVSFERATLLPIYIEEQGWPFRIVSDPDRRAYHAFGLTSATWSQMLQPRVFIAVVKMLWRGSKRGFRLRRPTPHVDVLQLGGDFVLDADRRVIYAYRSQGSTDRPPTEALIEALRERASACRAAT